MKKRFFRLLFLIIGLLILLFLITSCEKTYDIKTTNPDFLKGTWYVPYVSGKDSTSIVFENTSYSHQSFTPQKAVRYWEKGNWVVEYVQQKKEEEFTFDYGSSLQITVTSSSNAADAGKRSYLEFSYQEKPGALPDELTIIFDADHSLTLKKREQ